jgi:hypothetical protein
MIIENIKRTIENWVIITFRHGIRIDIEIELMILLVKHLKQLRMD